MKFIIISNAVIFVLYFLIKPSEECLVQDAATLFEQVYGFTISALSFTLNTLSLFTGYEVPTIENDAVYDFIIVGGGSAGSVIANRLTENPNWNVLLIEAGQEPCALMDLAALPAIWQYTPYNWNYMMERQNNFGQCLTDGLMAFPRGKGLGGSSLINFMMHVRGSKLDYDAWAALGNPGWNYSDVLHYFKKSEDCIVKVVDPGYHSQGGYLSTQDVSYRTEIVNKFVQAEQELGYNYIDYNGHSEIGVSYVQATTRRGLRCSTEKAFIRPVQNRENLHILLNSRVTKVLIDSNKKAYGVEYEKFGTRYTVKASKEVILSAGAFHSPQILMLSGIGPRDHLKQMNIPLVQDLPVGKKMYDHITFMGLVFTIEEPYSFQLTTWTNPIALGELAIFGTGPLTTLSAVEGVGYINTNVSAGVKDSLSSNPEEPDIELIFLGGGLHTDLGLLFRKVFRVSDEAYDTVWGPITGKYAWSIWPMLLHPKSFGRVELRSSDPLDSPKLTGNYFSDPDGLDLKTMLVAIRHVQKLAKTQTMLDVGTKQVTTPLPCCKNYVFDSDAYWECALRGLTSTLHHQTTTCRMGPKNDPEAVVDARLRVYGVKNLRVADPSVIPISPAGHTNIPATMIGEKCSDLIKEDYGYLDGVYFG